MVLREVSDRIALTEGVMIPDTVPMSSYVSRESPCGDHPLTLCVRCSCGAQVVTSEPTFPAVGPQ